MEHLTFHQQVIMGLIHGGVPSAVIALVGAILFRNQGRHAAKIHEQFNGGLEDRIRRAVKAALQTGEDA